MSLDRPRPVRAGEELDLEKLAECLGIGPLTAEQFPGGYSNLTYLIRSPHEEWVLRRPPRGANIKTAHDMEREFRLLSLIYPVWPRVPRPIRMVTDESVLGAPFFLMERVRGMVLRGPGQPPEVMKSLSEQVVDLLSELHSLAIEGLPGKPEGYVERQVSGWSERYRKAATDSHELAEPVMEWLAQNQPPQSGAALIHNDFKYDNLVLDPDDPTRVLAVLDWEMATLGDPLMDLGTTLGYWIDPDDPPELRAFGFGPTYLPGNLNRQQLIQRYANATRRQWRPFYLVFGLFKIAVIAQQIYARYRQGLTRDNRFAALGRAVQLLLQRADVESRRPR
jgi:aminoglycoside phosphotransferase (APT) family kinase protein